MEKSMVSDTGLKEKDIDLIKGIMLTVCGLIMSLSSLFGKPSPFGAAILCALNGFECLFVFVGAAAGYLVNGGLSIMIPYIAVMAVITALRFITAPMEKRLPGTLVCIACGVCLFIANVFVAEQVYDLFIGAVFAVISSMFGYCALMLRREGSIRLTLGAAMGKHDMNGAHSALIKACVGIIFIFLTASLTGFQIGIINAGIVLSAFAVIYSSDKSVNASSAVFAILSSAGIAMGEPDYTAGCILLSISAPVVMLIEKRGRITRACAFIFTVGIGMIITGANQVTAVTAASSAAAAAVYMSLPERYFRTGSFSKSSEQGVIRPFRVFAEKLSGMSEAVDDMKNAVIRTSQALDKENLKDPSWVYTKASEEICRSCPSNMKCWGELYGDTADDLNKALTSMRNGIFASEDMMPAGCQKRTELAAAVNRQYAVYCSALSASRKIADMRSVLTEQLGATETMLKRMSEELETNDTYDEEAAAETTLLLKDLGASDPAVSALVIDGRLCIDAYCRSAQIISPESFAERLSFAVRRELDLPMIAEKDGSLHITISERSRYDARIKVFQKSRAGNSRSGDCCEAFNDGSGSIYMILSDGMGSGSRARIDSAFTCSMLTKMLKAGIDMEASIEMLNTSLLVKSSDESFATLDICKIDLNTGSVTLCKAGGASTYIKCGGEVAEITDQGLPLGVSFGADHRDRSFTLSRGDIVLMTSDGAHIDKHWLEQLMLRDKDADLEKIIDTVGEALRLSQDKETGDDMTVIGVKIV